MTSAPCGTGEGPAGVTKVEARIARWSGFPLSTLGRAYVAKQVLASMVTYHATFVPVPQELLERLCRAIHTFVAANSGFSAAGCRITVQIMSRLNSYFGLCLNSSG